MKNNNEALKIEDEQAEKIYEMINKLPEQEHFSQDENKVSPILDYLGTMNWDENRLLHPEPCSFLGEDITGDTFNNYMEFPITCFLISSMQIKSFEYEEIYYFMTNYCNTYYFEISEKSEAFSKIVSTDSDLADIHNTVKIYGVAKENARLALEDFYEYILGDKSRWNF